MSRRHYYVMEGTGPLCGIPVRQGMRFGSSESTVTCPRCIRAAAREMREMEKQMAAEYRRKVCAPLTQAQLDAIAEMRARPTCSETAEVSGTTFRCTYIEDHERVYHRAYAPGGVAIEWSDTLGP